MKPYVIALIAALVALTSMCWCQPQSSSGRLLYTYDLTHTLKTDYANPIAVRSAWDETHFVTSIQGIVNRHGPKLYIFEVGGDHGAIDHFWLERLTEKGEWLAEWKQHSITDLKALIETFNAEIHGLVVYDEHVPATSNVASTAAGVESLACVRYDPAPTSLYTWLTTAANGPHLEIKLRLINTDGSPMFTGKGTLPGSRTLSSGSAKCDAYLWAKERYLDTGKCNPNRLGYYLDAWWITHPAGYLPNHTLTDHDFFISKRGFFFDLSPWADETPVDDPGQLLGTDDKTLRAILLSAYMQIKAKKPTDRMIHVGGFVPWPWKYTNYPGAGDKHEGVPAEWQYAQILSCYNAYMDADAIGLCAMANASVHTHYPLNAKYPQNKQTLETLRTRGLILPDGRVAPKSYVAIYGGDYDAASWLYQKLPESWPDPARGSIPMGWAFNPNLADRFASGMAYARNHATAQDLFIAGDSGAGYLNPSMLTPPRDFSGLPSGLSAWIDHCTTYYNRWDLSLTGFVIDGFARTMSSEVLDAYAKFSPDGVVGQKVFRLGMHGQMPIIRMESDLDDPASGAKQILARTRLERPEFFVYRTILWTPTQLKEMMELVKRDRDAGDGIEFVDPYTLMMLAKQFQSGPDHGTARIVPASTPSKGEVVNLWSLRYGVTVTGHSPLIAGCDARDIFGGTYGSLESHDLILFSDGLADGTTHWVEWKTRRPMRLDRIKVRAHGDGATGRREFRSAIIYSRSNEPGAPWQVISGVTPGHPYKFENGEDGLLANIQLDKPIEAQQFRAEFGQMSAPDGTTNGPRVLKLEGFGEYTP